MKKMKIAITGGIGSGKSTAIAYLQKLGYPVFSADEIYKEIIQSEEYIQRIRFIFPSAVENNQINRKVLAELVFADNKARAALNAVAHPMIMERLMNEMKNSEKPLVFAEIPLLFESNLQGHFDRILVIMRSEQERLLAVQERDGYEKEDVLARMQAQFPYDDKESLAYILSSNAILVYNDSTKDGLYKKLEAQIGEWKSKT